MSIPASFARLGLAALLAPLLSSLATAAETARGTVITEHLTSEVLRDTRIGVDPRRSVSIYLPPGYDPNGARSYPVIYYFHSLMQNNEQMFADGNPVQPVLDRAIARGVIGDFILVAANYSVPTLGCWYENSSTSGRWLDFTIQELIPYVDGRFRTLPQRESRGLTGDFTGGYGALKFAMLYPELFGAVYALHPVGTGTGLMPPQKVLDWRRLHRAKSFEELWGDHYAPGFVAMSQAYLPNPDRPPFYCDFVVELENGEPRLNPHNLETLYGRFLLDRLLARHADHLRRMRGIAFDWARYDTTVGHVLSNQAFTRTLDHLGIEHTAEEYSGSVGEKNWIEGGRVEDRLLPFFGRILVFEKADHSRNGDAAPEGAKKDREARTR